MLLAACTSSAITFDLQRRRNDERYVGQFMTRYSFVTHEAKYQRTKLEEGDRKITEDPV